MKKFYNIATDSTKPVNQNNVKCGLLKLSSDFDGCFLVINTKKSYIAHNNLFPQKQRLQ